MNDGTVRVNSAAKARWFQGGKSFVWFSTLQLPTWSARTDEGVIR